jgi:hypothetical protein
MGKPGIGALLGYNGERAPLPSHREDARTSGQLIAAGIYIQAEVFTPLPRG